VILTCFNMYQKWGKFFENVENFFDLVLIEEQMLQQKTVVLAVLGFPRDHITYTYWFYTDWKYVPRIIFYL